MYIFKIVYDLLKGKKKDKSRTLKYKPVYGTPKSRRIVGDIKVTSKGVLHPPTINRHRPRSIRP
jgi:hypothetical protein